jgi:hypothetical protein
MTLSITVSCVIMLNVVMMRVAFFIVMLSFIILSVNMMSVMAPLRDESLIEKPLSQIFSHFFTPHKHYSLL